MTMAKFLNSLRKGRSASFMSQRDPQASKSDLSFGTDSAETASNKSRRWSSGSSTDSSLSWEQGTDEKSTPSSLPSVPITITKRTRTQSPSIAPIYNGDTSSSLASTCVQLHQDQRRHFHGLGVLVMKDFAYAGEWVHSKPHGHGVYISRKDGHIYEGAFVSGYAHGFGRTASYAGNDNLYVYGRSMNGKYHASGSKGSSVRSKAVAAMSAARRNAMLALCTATPVVAEHFQTLSSSVQMPGNATALLFSSFAAAATTTSNSSSGSAQSRGMGSKEAASSRASSSAAVPRRASMPIIVEALNEEVAYRTSINASPAVAYTCRTAAELARSYYVAPGAVTALINMLMWP